jgi:hypothetical protein
VFPSADLGIWRKEEFLVLAGKLLCTRTKGIDIRLWCVISLCIVCVCVHALFDVVLLHLALKLSVYVSCLGQKTIIVIGI